jgi:hypothetical protein
MYQKQAGRKFRSICPYLLPSRPRTHWLLEDMWAGMLVVQKASNRA